jgi:rfaE bifunctional protein nucleotidyltransferase chain/domain/rfaE bifunctional protein kinase chain/domain
VSAVPTAGPLVVVGDALLDRDVDGQVRRLCPDAPAPVLEDQAPACRPGGAALAALMAARDGVPVVLVAPLGEDDASSTVLGLLASAVTVVRLPLDGSLPEKTRFRAGGRTLLRADRGDGTAGAPGAGSHDAADAIASAAAVLVCDYGRGVTADPEVRAALARQAGRVPLVWDPHPRGAPPVPHARLVTPNYAEAAGVTGMAGPPTVAAAAAAARDLGERWPVDAVAVTVAEHGAVLVQGGTGPLVVPAERQTVTDPCGAGDRFAAAAAVALRAGALTSEAVTSAVAAASRYLADGGVARYSTPEKSFKPLQSHEHQKTSAVSGIDAAPRPGPAQVAGPRAGEGPIELARRVRAAGGTVVATGGCFDLLHAGHVSLLETARSLGDCLIVCLNSDSSVRRLKGDGRPLNHAADRAAVLAALGSVDAIAVFEEDTPCAVLDRLRPDIWVKGGDYDGRELPEAALLETWGGVAVTVPYLSGRSTTRLAEAARDDAGLR